MKRNSPGTVTIDFLYELRRVLHHQMASDAGILMASQYVAVGLSFLTTAISARLLGPTDYGIAAQVIAYPTLIWSLVGIKSVSVTTRYISSYRATGQNERLKSICRLGYELDFLVAVVAFIVISASGWWVARHILNMPESGWLMIAYAASFPFSSVSGTNLAILSSWQQFRWLAGLNIFGEGLTLLSVLGFLWAGFGMSGMILGTAMAQAINPLITLCIVIYMLYREGVDPWWNTAGKGLLSLQNELASFFGWNYVAVTLSGLIGQVPLMLLGRLRGPDEAAFYRLATTLVTAGSSLEASLGKVAYPILSARWGAGERESLKSSLIRWTFRGGLPLGALVLLGIPLLPIVVPLLFSPGYSPIVLGAQVMMAGAAVNAVFFWVNSSYYAVGKIRPWTKAYSLYTASVIGLAWFCITQWGFTGLSCLVALAKVLFTLSMVAVFMNAREWHEHLPLPKTR